MTAVHHQIYKPHIDTNIVVKTRDVFEFLAPILAVLNKTMRQTFAALVTAHRLRHAWMGSHNYVYTTANVTCPVFPD